MVISEIEYSQLLMRLPKNLRISISNGIPFDFEMRNGRATGRDYRINNKIRSLIGVFALSKTVYSLLLFMDSGT